MGLAVDISYTTLQTPLCIMKSVTFLALWCLMAIPAWASHLLGGQIQAQNVSGTSYSIRITIYMDQAAGRQASDLMNTIPVCLGDGNVVNVGRSIQSTGTGNPMSINIYQFSHTYNGSGTYRITTSIANRTPVVNLSQAGDQVFTLSTMILATPNMRNSTPSFDILSDFWQVVTNQRTTLPFYAADNENDSLVYLLARPLTAPLATTCNSPSSLTQYQYPNAVSQKGTYKLNARTGELVWDAPTMAGQYSAIIRVQEWRNGVQISESYIETFIRVQDKAGTPSPIPPYEPAAEVGIITGTDPEADNGLMLTVSPNPVQNQFVARLRSSKVIKPTLQLLDLSGRIVAERTLTRPNTDHETTFSVENLPSGLYVLKVDVGGRVLSQKVMKQ